MRYRIIFFGSPDFAVPSLKALIDSGQFDLLAVVTQPDKPRGRGKKLLPTPVKTYALQHGLKVLEPQRLKKHNNLFLQKLDSLGTIDLAVVVAFGQILPAYVLAYPKHGCINVHASLLPRWRGAAPMQRAIMAGDSETGVCLIKMEEGLDTGPVYLSARLGLDRQDNLESVHNKLAVLGARLLIENLSKIIQGSLEATPQSSSGITYAEKITDIDSRINWHQPTQTIENQIRGLSPVPGAYTFFNSMRLKIFQAQAVNSGAADPLEPGQIAFCDKRTIEVQCGQGRLKLLELQLEGKQRLPVDVFLRGVEIHPRDYFSEERN